MPVLVVGVEAAIEITKENMWIALDTLRTHVREILNTGMDKYLLATDA